MTVVFKANHSHSHSLGTVRARDYTITIEPTSPSFPKELLLSIRLMFSVLLRSFFGNELNFNHPVERYRQEMNALEEWIDLCNQGQTDAGLTVTLCPRDPGIKTFIVFENVVPVLLDEGMCAQLSSPRWQVRLWVSGWPKKYANPTVSENTQPVSNPVIPESQEQSLKEGFIDATFYVLKEFPGLWKALNDFYRDNPIPKEPSTKYTSAQMTYASLDLKYKLK